MNDTADRLVQLHVCNATPRDLSAIRALFVRAYAGSGVSRVDAVMEGREHDPVLTFQLRNDLQVIGLMPAYWPEDKQSRGYGIYLLWHNTHAPDAQEEERCCTRTTQSAP